MSSVVNSTCTTATYNAALNRTAYQSSVFRLYKPLWINFSARLVNDGNRETTWMKNNTAMCSHSGIRNETNPWWAVDLGRPMTICSVDFTNRDAYGSSVIVKDIIFISAK